MSTRGSQGQALVEAALVLPIILILFSGLYIACRTAFAASAAQSATQTEALRVGRQLPGIEKQLAAALLLGEDGASVKGTSGRETRLLPSPFPSLAGRSSGIVSIDKEWTEIGRTGDLPALALVRRSDLSADCWNVASRSGRNIRWTVRARVALGALW